MTISTRFKNGDVLFSWYNPRKMYSYYYVFINNKNVGWIPDTEYTVKDALMYDCINITVRTDRPYEDYKLTYNGELEACCLHYILQYYLPNARQQV